MSWAANRKTTRGEDMSYSLVGLFDVNLTPIYGEGARRAFLRLQEAIMSSTNDMSLFAWKSTDTEAFRGVLARSPKEFGHAGKLVHRRFLGPNPEFSMTNRGLKIMPLLSKRPDGRTYFLPLNCAESKEDSEQTEEDSAQTKEDSEQSLGIILYKQPGNDELLRYEPGNLPFFDRNIFTHDYEFWLKQSETPIYIVRDERHPKDTSRERSPSEFPRERESRRNLTSGMVANEGDKAKSTKPVATKRPPSPSDISEIKMELSEETHRSMLKRHVKNRWQSGVPSNNTPQTVEADLISATISALTLSIRY
jgi:hypothetical protein